MIPADGLFDWPLAAGAAAVLLAGGVRALAGFGGALVMSPILSLLYGPAAAVTMVIAFELAGYLQLLPAEARRIPWRNVAPMVAAALVMVPLGAWLVLHVDAGAMRRVIGGVVVVLALVLLSGLRARRDPGLGGALAAAGVSGLLEGLAATPGPPVVLYLYGGPTSALESRRRLIGYFTLLDAAALGWFLWQGALVGDALWRAVLLLPVSIVATWGGARLVHRTGEPLLRRIALGIILASGLAGLLV